VSHVLVLIYTFFDVVVVPYCVCATDRQTDRDRRHATRCWSALKEGHVIMQHSNRASERILCLIVLAMITG